jgi:hypothetical protein
MRSVILTGLVVVAAVTATGAQAPPGFDMAAIQKWQAAKIVHFRISGVFKGTTSIARGSDAQYAQAVVSDGFTVELDLQMRHQELVGAAKFTNTRTTMTGVASPGIVKCPPPTPSGEFEYFEIAKVVNGQSAVELQGTRTYPAIALSNQWPATCAQRPVAGGTEPVTVTLAVPSPVMLALPANADPKFAVTPDRKSFVLKAEDWTWTYTPTIVQ